MLETTRGVVEAFRQCPPEPLLCAPACQRDEASREPCRGGSAEAPPTLTKRFLAPRHLLHRAEPREIGCRPRQALGPHAHESGQQLDDALLLEQQTLNLARDPLGGFSVQAPAAL